MDSISCYDDDARLIEKVCEDNDLTEPEVIEVLLDYLNDAKKFYGWIQAAKCYLQKLLIQKEVEF